MSCNSFRPGNFSYGAGRVVVNRRSRVRVRAEIQRAIERIPLDGEAQRQVQLNHRTGYVFLGARIYLVIVGRRYVCYGRKSAGERCAATDTDRNQLPGRSRSEKQDKY
jgi:hypothetical protein